MAKTLDCGCILAKKLHPIRCELADEIRDEVSLRMHEYFMNPTQDNLQYLASVIEEYLEHFPHEAFVRFSEGYTAPEVFEIE